MAQRPSLIQITVLIQDPRWACLQNSLWPHWTARTHIPYGTRHGLPVRTQGVVTQRKSMCVQDRTRGCSTRFGKAKGGLQVMATLRANNDYKYGQRSMRLNSLTPGKFEWNSRYVIFKQIFVIDGWGISCEIALIWMSLDTIDDQSTLVQVMAWCRQATSHYLGQCWPRSLPPYGVTRPQWVK